ncbi:Vacuolar protein-sorting-associated protein 28 [Actinomortierella ambigua]|uniref:Vacuolar protein sorting-associated protein 28 n=1 Tax=Actinomortierella ambigua TaxID=1343610 RepID=A0A9P6QL08_9FUNG|nr:Vacuolar protein-sorting-associated protein 28 [Actinomortierella ambigua]KAG0268012.1 Vacuolar protein-sorting-associated protein 28 [Actinomortierella ambigua]
MSFSSTQQYLASVNGMSSPTTSYQTSFFGGGSGGRGVPTCSLDEEIKLTTNNRERAQMDNMADLYSIIVALNHLEQAYIRTQFKTAMSLLGDVVPDLEKFLKEYDLDCTAATKRIKIGVPATVEFGDGVNMEASGQRTVKAAVEAASSYITVIDTIKLGMVAADQVYPLLAELMQCLNNVQALPADFEGRAKLLEWLIKTNGMKASEELDANERRQLEFDLESSLTAFHAWLSTVG